MVVFVHIGARIPKYLLLNLERCVRVFPQQSFAVISDQPLTFFKSLNMDLRNRFEIFNYSESMLQPEENKVLVNLENDMRFRTGYWRLTLERLFSLKYFQKEFESSLLHLESDILLLPNFPFETIISYAENSMMWGDCRTGEDSAALFYSPNYFAISQFTVEACKLLKKSPNLTDMSLLYQIRKASNLDVKLFPTGAPILEQDLSLDKVEGKNQENPETLHGIFDSAALGMWLTGIDPRNDYGFTIAGDSRHNIESKYKSQPQLYRNLDLTNEGILQADSLPVYSIHVHSKNPKLFGKDWEKQLREFVMASKKHQRLRIVKFSPFLLLSLIQSNRLNGTLMSFMNHFLKRIRTYISRRTSND